MSVGRSLNHENNCQGACFWLIERGHVSICEMFIWIFKYPLSTSLYQWIISIPPLWGVFGENFSIPRKIIFYYFNEVIPKTRAFPKNKIDHSVGKFNLLQR